MYFIVAKLENIPMLALFIVSLPQPIYPNLSFQASGQSVKYTKKRGGANL